MEFLQSNWVDLIILAIMAYFLLGGWRAGVWIVLADFLSFAMSLIIALRFYPSIANLLKDNFSLHASVANALSFLLTAMASEAIFGVLLGKLVSKIPEKVRESLISKYAALIPALGQGLVLLGFLLTLVMAFPINPSIKKDISESKAGSQILAHTSNLEAALNDVFGGVIQDSLTYFTIRPESHESIALDVEVGELTVDETAEQAMFSLVNQERLKAGVGQLAWDPAIVPVARAHAEDMWRRKYFAHISPEGKDVGDRLQAANVDYSFAGENLAQAPTTQTAHIGLMNSEGHRANILEPRFKKVGIGVIDNGYYGKMFVQVFTD